MVAATTLDEARKININKAVEIRMLFDVSDQWYDELGRCAWKL